MDSCLFSIFVDVDQDAIFQRDRQTFKHWFSFVIYHHHSILWEVIRYASTFLCYHMGWERGCNFKFLGNAFNFIYSRRQIVFHVDGYLFSLYKHSLAFNKRSAFDLLCAILPVSLSTNKGRFDNGTSAARARKGKYRSNIRHKTPQENQLARPLASPSDYYYSQGLHMCKPKALKFLNYFLYIAITLLVAFVNSF